MSIAYRQPQITISHLDSTILSTRPTMHPFIRQRWTARYLRTMVDSTVSTTRLPVGMVTTTRAAMIPCTRNGTPSKHTILCMLQHPMSWAWVHLLALTILLLLLPYQPQRKAIRQASVLTVTTRCLLVSLLHIYHHLMVTISDLP